MTHARAGLEKNLSDAMGNKPKTLKVRASDKDIFDALASGQKKIETRARTEKYKNIKAGDFVIFACGAKRIKKRVKKVECFRSIAAILKKYKPKDINPKIKTAKEAVEMWHSFPGYNVKIKRCGLIAMQLW